MQAAGSSSQQPWKCEVFGCGAAGPSVLLPLLLLPLHATSTLHRPLGSGAKDKLLSVSILHLS